MFTNPTFPKVHRDKFNELIVSERVRPTVMLPVWEVAAFALGAGMNTE